MKVTATANANIALIKYWGRRNDEFVLPFNNSISFTMDDQLQTVTSIEFQDHLAQDELILDGKLANESEQKRIQNFLNVVREKAKLNRYAHIVSKNSFPKSAGLASSASAFAALAKAAAKSAGLSPDDRELSMLARRGSGSAARSIHGGAVEWKAGEANDGSDSYAVQLMVPDGWKELRNIVVISNEHEKKIGSAAGMRFSVQNSSLFKSRLEGIIQRLEVIREGIRRKNFEMMATTIMQESNNMHAVMLDSWPPLIYLNEFSFKVISAILDFNSRYGKNVAAYTFDAGPNAHIYTTTKYEKEIRAILEEISGIKKIIMCQIGQGAKFSNQHLF